MKNLAQTIHYIIMASLVLALLGGIIDIAQKGGISKEHMWNDSILLMLFALVLVQMAK